MFQSLYYASINTTDIFIPSIYCFFFNSLAPGRHGSYFDTLKQWQNGRHFSYDIFKCIFLNEIVWISNTIWLKFIPTGPRDHSTALVQIMAWRWTGDKPLSEPMMAKVGDAYMLHSASMSSVIISDYILRIKIMHTSCGNSLRWMPQNPLIIGQHWFR